MDPSYQVVRIDPGCPAYGHGLRTGHYVWVAEYSLSWDRIGLGFGEEPVAKNAKIVTVPMDYVQSELAFTHPVPAEVMLKAPSVSSAFGMAWADTVGHSTMVFVVLHRLITREVDMKNMAGPLGMAGILTTVASKRSFTYYLWWLAMLSLNLGVLQFVPIPLLDGWHLVLVTVEKLKGSPVSLKVQEVFQYAGLFLILALLLFVTKNDIMRFFIH
jgi:RIP metalloprotease RseP